MKDCNARFNILKITLQSFAILIMFALNSLTATSQIRTSREFEYIPTGGAAINSIFNDSQGRILATSSNGLLIYNGKLFKNFTPNENGVVFDGNAYAALPIADDNLLLCTPDGLYNIDLHSDIFSFIYETASLDIKSIARMDSSYVILGCTTGLATVNIKNRQTRKLKGAPSRPYNKLLAKDNKIYAGYDGGILVYDNVSKSCHTIPLTDNDRRHRNVMALAADNIRNCIWIGTDSGIFKYPISSEELVAVDSFNGLSISSLLVDGIGDLWIGTKSGLFIFNEESGQSNHYTHNSNDPTSLVDNEVKSLFEDEFGNIWIGTEAGVSFFFKNSNFSVQRWGNLSKSTAGGRITSILVDSGNYLWIGSSDGLIKHNNNEGNRSEGVSLPGHRINNIMEDTDGNIWIATDKGLNFYNKTQDKFTEFIITDTTGKYHAYDCANVFEDSKGNIWVATASNGIFGIDKRSIMKNPHGVVADIHLFTLPGNGGPVSKKIGRCVVDNKGNLWVAASVDGLTKIYPDSGRMEYFSFSQSEKHLNVKDISFIHCDNEGMIWVAGKGTIDKIDPNNDAITHIEGDALKGKMFNNIVDKDNNIWLLYPEGIIAIDKTTNHMVNLSLPGTNYSCMYLDVKSGYIWISGKDHIIHFSPEAVLMPSSFRGTLTLTSLYVNNQEIFPQHDYDGNVILRNTLPFTKEITLNPSQNNIDLEFSASKADKGNVVRYRYSITDSDDDWREIEGPNFHIPFNNLPKGSFTLQIQQLENDGSVAGFPPYELKVTVLPHWYASVWAKILYVLLGVALVGWAIKYKFMKDRLKFEKLEKEKVKEVSDLKINFLTDIAHELKTPLSLILEPVNKLISTSRSPEQKASLQIVRNNALHLGKLVHQVLNLRNVDIDQLMERTYPLEIVEFANSVVTSFKEHTGQRKIELSFKSSVESFMIMTDALKMESILRNLISNAIKFTPDGGKVEICLDIIENEDKKELILTVKDSGVGIPAEDLSKIFDRFYQSEHGRAINKDGSGIGLSVVRSYVHQFNGEINVESQIDKGTTFTIAIPAVEPDDSYSYSDGDDPSLADICGVKVLIVEDNVDIARFILENLKKMDCKIAHNGQSGFELAKSFQPDVVISDIMMPVMDGIEMSRLLKNNPSTSSIPIILLTAKDDKHTEYDAYDIGVDAFIPKPFEIRQLMIRIRQLLKSRLSACNSQSDVSSEGRTASVVDALATTDERFRDDITKLIEQHIDDADLNVQRLAELSGVSSKQIYRKIKLITGSTVVDYIKSIRMKKAAQLLSRRQFTVSEVMYMVGFSSSSYFSKCFMEKYGQNPKNYMDSCESDS